MDEETFKQRTKRFGLSVIRLVETLPRSRTAEILGRPLLRAGTSVGANYRAACRGKSAADVVAKLGIVEEEADESIYWIELLVEAGVVAPNSADLLKKEANELLAMTVASIKTLRSRKLGTAKDSRFWISDSKLLQQSLPVAEGTAMVQI
jgi:four helix bundle protein